MALEIAALLLLLVCSQFLSPVEVVVLAVLAALAFAPVSVAIEARGKGDRVFVNAKTHFSLLGVQRGRTVYLPSEAVPVRPGTHTIVLTGRGIVVDERAYPAKVAEADEERDYALYVSVSD